MRKSTTFLNYLAFLTLFITSIIFLFTENSVIIGYILAFISTTLFIFFLFSEFSENLDDYTYFISSISLLSILFSAILHFVSLICILTLIYKLHVKYTVNNGLPLLIAEPYKSQMHIFNIIMTSVFCSCAVLTIIINFRWSQIDINFYELLKLINPYLFYKNITLFIALILSLFSLGASIYQTIVAVEFSKLSRQQIVPSEYKTKQ